ncbi:hypothetical protein VNO77_03768 [Canavalia gladiata]|uniref:Uncharacterized protein n=1 Tax=Canavalia gladiata TaxID=3824 RepID=A0AAN9MVG4_CANGL
MIHRGRSRSGSWYERYVDCIEPGIAHACQTCVRLKPQKSGWGIASGSNREHTSRLRFHSRKAKYPRIVDIHKVITYNIYLVLYFDSGAIIEKTFY